MEVCPTCDIVFIDRKGCPLCRANDEISAMNDVIEGLREEIYNMEQKT